MRIILRKGPHPHDPMQRPGRFISMTRAKFCHPQGQVTIGFYPLAVNLNMTRTVHRFQSQCPVFCGFSGKHIIAEFIPVTRSFPQAAINKLRCLHFAVTRRIQAATHIHFNLAIQSPAFGMPEDRPGRFFLKMKKIQLAAQFTVITLFCFFKHGQILRQILFGQPGCTINPLQHRPV